LIWTCVWRASGDHLEIDGVVIVTALVDGRCGLIVVCVAVVVIVIVVTAAEAGQMNVRPSVVAFEGAAVHMRRRG
jgi:hypothetical protein